MASRIGPPRAIAPAPNDRRQRRTRRRRPRTALLVLATLCATAVSAQISVARLKSLFVERFTRFVDWPSGALPQGAAFVVCVAGSGDAADGLFDFARTAKWKG